MKSLPESRFKPAEFLRTTWHVTAANGVTLETITDPDCSFWANVVRRIRPQDIIEVHAEDRSFFARLYVLAMEGKFLQLHVLEHHEFGATTLAEPDTYKVDWRGPHSKFSVIRVRDKEVVKTGYQTKPEALAAAGELARQYAA